MDIIFDIETDGLYHEATKVHCIAIQQDNSKPKVYTSKPLPSSDGLLDEGVQLLQQADCLIGHNIINYDIPVLNKLGYNIQPSKVYDTMIASQLTYPNLMLQDANKKSLPPKEKGRHSLKAWGYRLRVLKGEFGETNNWETLTEEMVDYCKQDVVVTAKLYSKLLTRNIPTEALTLEQDFAKVISRQEKYGVYFDVKAAQKLHIELLEEVENAEQQLHQVFKPLKTWTPKPYPKTPYKKNGDKSQVLLNQEAMGCHFNSEDEWGYYQYIDFNPSSRQHIVRWLKEVYNWKPKEFTEKGSPIVNESILDKLDFPEAAVLAHYFHVTKLLGQLAVGKNAWLKMVDNKNRIHGRVNTLGAVSRRCTHSSPNMAQVPSSRAYKGKETRQLFCVPKGKKLVGCDADGLELRTLSHYLARFDGGVYGKAVDSGDKDKGTDIHTLNQKAAGLPTRDDAKTFIYAFLYGAGDAKIGEIVGGTAATGQQLKTKFFRQIPAVKKLVDKVAQVYKDTNTLKALDGNPYYIRSAHSALNTLLQGAGAVVMKYYLVFLDRNLARNYTKGEQYEFVLNVHDEVQIECDEDIAKEVASIAEATFDDVTKHLQFKIPLRGSAAIGDSWAETH